MPVTANSRAGSWGPTVIVPIEIKLNIGGDLDAAIEAVVPSSAKPMRRTIWFAESSPGIAAGELTLYRSHVILRIRTGDGDDDSTAKIRPCTGSQLKSPWTEDQKDKKKGFEYRIEGDWSEAGRMLAASAVVTHHEGTLWPTPDPADAFNRTQRQFLKQCAYTSLADEELTALGPVTATKWADVTLGKHPISMERWTVGTLDFLELSIRIDKKHGDSGDALRHRAKRHQESLEAAALARGLTKDANPENKTQRVLEHLMAR